MSESRDIINAFKTELRSHLKDGTVTDPALFWAGKMSQQIQTIYSSHITKVSDRIQLLYEICEEYDKVIIGRMELT